MAFFVRKEQNGQYVHRCHWDNGVNQLVPGQNGYWGSSEDKKTGITVVYYYDPQKGTLVIEVWDKNPRTHPNDAKLIRSTKPPITAPTKPTDIPRPEDVPPVEETSNECL